MKRDLNFILKSPVSLNDKWSAVLMRYLSPKLKIYNLWLKRVRIFKKFKLNKSIFFKKFKNLKKKKHKFLKKFKILKKNNKVINKSKKNKILSISKFLKKIKILKKKNPNTKKLFGKIKLTNKIFQPKTTNTAKLYSKNALSIKDMLLLKKN